MLEDALRQTFAARAEEAPPLDGVADAAIRRARSTRRRHAVGTTLAGIAVLVVVGALVVRVMPGGLTESDLSSMAGPGAGAPGVVRSAGSGAPRPAVVPLELVIGNEIHIKGKQPLTVDLEQRSGERVSRVFRAADGYLVITDSDPAGKQQLYRLDNGGQQTIMLYASQNITVSPTGDQIAWRDRTVMSVADRKGAVLGLKKSTQAPTSGGPIGFLGDQVLIGRTAGSPTDRDATGSTGPDSRPGPPAPVAFDRWDPSGAGYRETWSSNVFRIFGEMPEGKRVVAQVLDPATGDRCLATLVAAHPFQVQETACGLPEAAEVGGAISPDGRWLAYPTMSASRVQLVDLDVVFRKPVPAGVWKFDAPVRSMVWADDATMVVDAGDRLARLDTTVPGKLAYVGAEAGGKVMIEPLRE